MILLKNVSKAFGGKPALSDISICLPAKKVTVVTGPNGSGKTTLLRCIAGLERPDSGRVSLGAGAGMVFQNCNLWPHKTVLENATLALTLAQGMGWKDAREKAMHALQKVGMSKKADRFPGSLSGGEQQRAAIARTLAAGPQILLLDEITANLDQKFVGEVEAILLQQKKEGKTIVAVTHNSVFASRIADQIVQLNKGRVVLVEKAIRRRSCGCGL